MSIRSAQRARGCLELTLAQAERSNALSPVMVRELDQHIAAAGNGSEVRLVVLRGEGKHFCSGADIGASRGRDEHPARGPSIAEMLLRWDACFKPTVAFVQGACLGAGLALASCCDVVIASRNAFFAIPEVRRGMTPGILPFFQRAIGARAFRRYGLSGERFDAATALRLGLVSEILDAGEWDRAQAKLLDAFLYAAPRTLAAIKSIAAQAAVDRIDPDQLLRKQVQVEDEASEGKASFREKRNPDWYLEE